MLQMLSSLFCLIKPPSLRLNIQAGKTLQEKYHGMEKHQREKLPYGAIRG
jgi:hypothetical protein